MERGQKRVPIRPEIARVEAYVPGESLDAFSARTGVPRDRLIKLNSNESPYPPSPRVSRALGDHTAYNLYPDPDGHELLAAIAQYVGLDARHLVLANGSNELITQLWRVFIGAGESVVTCSPTFSLYTTATTLAGGTLINVPRGDDYALDVEGVLAALRDDTRLIIVCSPNNPTGNLAAPEDVDALLATGRIVVVDEAYIEFAGDDARDASPIARVHQHENLVVLRTFSKWAGLAGLRLGYGAFPQWLVPHVRAVQLPFEVNLAAHLAARETLEDLPLLRERIAGLIEERDHLHALLAAQPYLRVFPSRGNFLLVELTDPRLSLAAFRAAMESAGIILRYFRTPDLARHVRLTVGAPEHTAAIAAVLAGIAESLGVRVAAPAGALAR